MEVEVQVPLSAKGTKEAVAECLAECLANAVVLALKAQGHHWNVKGIHFSQFHDFFAAIYSDVYDTWDPIAENIQKLGFDAPFRLVEFARLTSMEDVMVGNDPMAMVADLLAANATMIACINDCFKAATAADEQGIADFMAGRDGMHKKWDWQLKSYLTPEAVKF